MLAIGNVRQCNIFERDVYAIRNAIIGFLCAIFLMCVQQKREGHAPPGKPVVDLLVFGFNAFSCACKNEAWELNQNFFFISLAIKFLSSFCRLFQ